MAALVVANLVPLVGVLGWGWDAFILLLLFWLENVVVGFFNVLRMALAQGDGAGRRGWKVVDVFAFVVHFGAFTMAHGLLLFTIFSQATGGAGAEPGTLVPLAWTQIQTHRLGWSLLALFVSHGISFVSNTVLGGEYRRMRVRKQMSRPYGRVMMMHVTVLFGAILAQATGNAVWALVVLVGVKLAADWRGHLKERRLMSRTMTKTLPKEPAAG